MTTHGAEASVGHSRLTCTVDQPDGTHLGMGVLHCMQVAPDDWVLVVEMADTSPLAQVEGTDAVGPVLVRAAQGPVHSAVIERVSPQPAFRRHYIVRLAAPSPTLTPAIIETASQEGVPAMPKQAPDATYSIAEIATRLRLDETVVTGWVQSGQLHGTRVGADWRIAEADLEGFLQRLRGQTPEE